MSIFGIGSAATLAASLIVAFPLPIAASSITLEPLADVDSLVNLASFAIVDVFSGLDIDEDDVDVETDDSVLGIEF